jgi:hypothetical protein
LSPGREPYNLGEGNGKFFESLVVDQFGVIPDRVRRTVIPGTGFARAGVGKDCQFLGKKTQARSFGISNLGRFFRQIFEFKGLIAKISELCL